MTFCQQFKKKVNLKLIREFHSMIMNLLHETPGMFRRINLVYITGCDLGVIPTNMIEIDLKDLITRYYNAIENKKHPFEQAILFHYQFEMIHPFTDGNGRTGREVMNYLLLKNEYPRLMFPEESRRSYLSALEFGNKGSYPEMMKIFVDLMVDGYAKELNDLKSVLNPIQGQTNLEDYMQTTSTIKRSRVKSKKITQ